MSLYLNDDLSALDYVQLDYLRELQLERLKKIVRHAYTNVTLFRSRMDERGLTPDCIRTLGDLGKLPFTVKADLRDTYPFGLFAVPMSQVVRLHASQRHHRQADRGRLYPAGFLDIWMQVMKRALASCGLTHEDVIQVSVPATGSSPADSAPITAPKRSVLLSCRLPAATRSARSC
ncbi:MAG: hypothetical protein V8T86_01075 [Victivallis sp.]